jgi:hypothetical protein
MGKGQAETPNALASRQREHRLKARITPKVQATSDSDPWLIADQALDYIDALRPRFRDGSAGLHALDEAEELVKRLAYGPSD